MKKLIAPIAPIALALLSAAALAANPVVSYFPEHGLGALLLNQFDLASIRSSLGPRRSPGKNTFAALGMAPSLTQDDKVVFDSASWFYSMTVLRRGDFNNDGIEDLEVCFVDHAKGLGTGGYDAQQALLVTRTAPGAGLVALAYRMDGCETFAR